MFRNLFAVLVAMFWATTVAAQAQQPLIIPNEEIAQILREHLEARQAAGIVVGVIEPAGRRIVAGGRFGDRDDRP